MPSKYSTALALAAALSGMALSGGPRPAAAAADQGLGMAIMSARVAADGTFVRGHGVVASQKTGTGDYELTLNREFTDDCVLAGTSNSQITVHFQFSNANKVRVNVFVAGVGSFDADFQVIIFCAR